MHPSPTSPTAGRRRVTIIGTALIALTALFSGVMGAPALAATGPSITATPDAVQTDHLLTISGTNFPSGYSIDLYLDGPAGPNSTYMGSLGTSSGTFTYQARVPITVTPGMHTLTATTFNMMFGPGPGPLPGPGFGPGPSATTPVYVNATGPGGAALHPVITIGDLTTPGKGQTVTLWGFFPGESVAGEYSAGQYGGGPTGQTAIADSNGRVAFTYVYPASTAKGWTTTTGSAEFAMNGIGSQSQVNAAASFAVVPNPPTIAPAPLPTPKVPAPAPAPAPKPGAPAPVAPAPVAPAPAAPAPTTASGAGTVSVAPVAVAVAGRAHFTG